MNKENQTHKTNLVSAIFHKVNSYFESQNMEDMKPTGLYLIQMYSDLKSITDSVLHFNQYL